VRASELGFLSLGLDRRRREGEDRDSDSNPHSACLVEWHWRKEEEDRLVFGPRAQAKTAQEYISFNYVLIISIDSSAPKKKVVIHFYESFNRILVLPLVHIN
jgi:hypothetical protein